MKSTNWFKAEKPGKKVFTTATLVTTDTGLRLTADGKVIELAASEKELDALTAKIAKQKEVNAKAKEKSEAAKGKPKPIKKAAKKVVVKKKVTKPTKVIGLKEPKEEVA